MKILKILFIILVTVAVLGSALFVFYEVLRPAPAGLSVNTSPASSVYINGNYVAKTPYKGTFNSGQINIKLIPDKKDQKFEPYETKVNLVSGIQTVVDYEFALNDEEAAGVVISFDKIGGQDAGVAVISTPDGAGVVIDGAPQGKTPFTFDTITTGSHKLTIKNEGYTDKNINIKTVKGLRLNIFVKLAKINKTLAAETENASQSAGIKGFVLISKTSTGYLRMRTEPGTKGEEIAEIKEGSKFPFLDKDLGTGWYKIQYQVPAPGLPNGITGWVSNQYSKVVDDTGAEIKITASPSSSPALVSTATTSASLKSSPSPTPKASP